MILRMENRMHESSIQRNDNDTVDSTPKRRVLGARRVALFASAAIIAGSSMLAGASLLPGVTPSISTAHARTVMRPASFADIVEKVKPAVFAVRVKSESGPALMDFKDGDQPSGGRSPMERFFERFGFDDLPDRWMPDRRKRFSLSQGSGFFISPDGYAVTNNHVVERGQTVEIKTDDGKTYQAEVIGTDPRTDLALLKAKGRDDFPHVEFAETRPRVGDWVLAVGNPFGLGGTVTAGIVSASGRNIGAGPYDDFIQIDAPVNKGNSGGPTFNAEGAVVGVNTAIYSPSGGNVGIAFAIPADMVKHVVAALKEKGVVTRGWIGVRVQPVTSDIAESMGLKEARGALVAQVTPDGPAAKAGLEAGDVIVSVEGDAVKDGRDLARKIAGRDPDQSVKLGILRDGGERTVDLKLAEMPDSPETRFGMDRRDSQRRDVPRLGLTLAPADAENGTAGKGVVVTDVDPDGPAAERGVRSGDVILEVGGKEVRRPADVRKALQEARAEDKRTVLMRLKSGEQVRFVAVPLKRA
jgi:serine protease Do